MWKLFFSLNSEIPCRHKKQHSMNQVGHAGCGKKVAKNKIFDLKIGKNTKFLDSWGLCTWKESLKNVQFISITKKKKKLFFEILVEPLMSKLSKSQVT